MAKSKQSELSDQCVPSVDRISALPESLICHILSFLPTLYAVQTCILSKTWRHMWMNVTSVNFNQWMTYQFEQFVSKLLVLLKTPCLHMFHLQGMVVSDPLLVSTWVSAALSRGVQKLILNVGLLVSFEIPINLFTCKTLSCLTLNSNSYTILDVPNSVYLPNLKEIHIRGFTFANDETVPKLLSGCPVLEHLWFVIYCLDNKFHFSISSPTLKSLHLDFEWCLEHGYPRHTLQIDAPLLKYLDLKDYISFEFVIQNLSSVIQADISLHTNIRSNDETLYGNEVLKLIHGLSNVKFLRLSSTTMKALSYGREYDTPVLNNLTRLNVNLGKNRDWCIQSDGMPEYLLSHLTIAEFTYFEGSIDELEIVKFILNGAKSLERMTIKTIHPETKLDLLQEITMFPRHSKLCELLVR